ncbi:replication initiation protein [Fusobacterium mortiferum]|jgi:plasmid replication initiation protein|uniref:replication initiation protein n=1 Tax=Fusobacterium mortiferum TaxID=850 RepID=UPI0022E0CD0D|nr:replication initiation protein [Fusobacterium mortiferum]
MNKDIENIYVDLKVRTSKVENKIFQIILDKIRENIENLDNIYNLGLNIELKEISESFQNIEIALKGLMGKGIDINYLKGERRIFNTFNYVTSYTYNGEIFNIFIPLNILNCFKKNTLEYKISLRTFFYLRKKAVINFFNLLIKDIEQNRDIEVSLEELRDIFEISKESYDRFFDFEKNILKPLVEKVNNYSNFVIEYEKIKKGENKNNKVIGIRFKIHNIEIEKNKGETNYLIQIIKNMITDYQEIWESINSSIQHYGFESTRRNILFLKENGLEISDDDIKIYLKNDGRNIEEILKISDHILIKEKYSIYKDSNTFLKTIYDTIIGYDFYYSLNFNFLSIIKNYREGESLYYKDSTFVIFGNYKNNKGFFKIFESRDKK